MLHIRPIAPEDAPARLALRRALWPEVSESEHREEIEAFFAGGLFEPQAVFLATDDDGAVIGKAEVSIRPIAEGCRTNRVGYLEGWYVAPDHRRAGVGRLLVEAAETWSRAQGCTEFASDTESDNTPSRLAQRAPGFEEVGVVRCFRKGL